MKGLLSAFAVILATTACAGNSGENKKSNESTKEDNKMEVVALTTSVPAPMAMPVSARVRAGASLMPSPTMATLDRKSVV